MGELHRSSPKTWWLPWLREGPSGAAGCPPSRCFGRAPGSVRGWGLLLAPLPPALCAPPPQCCGFHTSSLRCSVTSRGAGWPRGQGVLRSAQSQHQSWSRTPASSCCCPGSKLGREHRGFGETSPVPPPRATPQGCGASGAVTRDRAGETSSFLFLFFSFSFPFLLLPVIRSRGGSAGQTCRLLLRAAPPGSRGCHNGSAQLAPRRGGRAEPDSPAGTSGDGFSLHITPENMFFKSDTQLGGELMTLSGPLKAVGELGAHPPAAPCARAPAPPGTWAARHGSNFYFLGQGARFGVILGAPTVPGAGRVLLAWGPGCSALGDRAVPAAG